MKEQQSYKKALGGITSRLLLLVLFCAIGFASYAQRISISGTIKDKTGEPLIGVNITERGTTNGTVTNIDGQFNLQVGSDATIVVSFIGYESQTIKVSGKNMFNITLEDSNLELGDVVVVGYGQQRKESVVGAISQVSSKDLLKSSSPNITQAIAGKLAGVVTTQTSGAPGADDALIYIRGRASFAGDNQPLIMVDGIEREFSQIAPDDIENISVLKDASATAVYGVRGANGVILVTTKRGKVQAPTISLTANFQMQSPTRRDTYLDSYNSVVLLEEALANDNQPSQYSEADIEMFRKSCNGELTGSDEWLSQQYPNVDWYDEILKKSTPAQRYNVNIQGGTKRMRYFTSLEYYNQGGLYKDINNYEYGQSGQVNFKRYSFRANFDFDFTKRFTASINFGTRFEERRGPNITDNTTYNEVFYELNHAPGWLYPVKYKNGLWGGTSQYQNNIAAKLAQGGFYQDVRTINETNFILRHDLDFITKGLSVRGQLSFDYDSNYDRRFTNTFATYSIKAVGEGQSYTEQYFDNEENYTIFNEDGELTYSGNNQEVTMKTYLEFALDYNHTFAGNHEVTALLLYSQDDKRYQADLAKRYQGVVGRVTYNYARRYLAELNAGYNGSENFAEGNRFGFFPSFSAGWVLSNESFMQNTKSWLDNLKIRASYGEVGNDIYKRNGSEIRFLYMDSWTQASNIYTFGDTNSQTGIYEGEYPNYGVTWERAKKYNFAVEGMLKDGLFSFNVDLFKEHRNNILTEYLSTPNWIGVTMAPGNLGETKNQGFEIELKHRNSIGDFNYNIAATFARAKNTILDMDEPDLKTEYMKSEGHPIEQYFGLVCEGFLTQADIENPAAPISTFGTTQAGDLKYKDMNSDGFIDSRDVTFIGFSDVPENTYSISVGADYKGWAISLMFQGVSNVSRYYDAEAQFAFIDGGKVREHHLDRWNPSKSEADNLANAKYPLLHYDDFGNHNNLASSFFLQSGNYLRLKNVEVSYTLPDFTRKWKMDEVRFYVNGNNLITWDKLDGMIDPESNGSNRYPIMKAVNFGVNIKF